MSYQQYQTPQSQSQTQTTTQGALQWNGSAWVPSSSKSPVELYTEYYHGWQACLQDYQNQSSSTADRQSGIDWARYYADQSSLAAHYYYEQMAARSSSSSSSSSTTTTTNTTAAAQIPPPPFELPPAPPPRRSSVAAVPPPATVATRKQDDRTPGSLTSYVQRSLLQCTTAEQRADVQAQVEKVIAKAIQDGNLHTHNWNAEPLIPVHGAAAPWNPSSSHPSADSYPSRTDPSLSYYAPSSSAASASAASSYPRRDHRPPQSTTDPSLSYYAPSSFSASSFFPSTSQVQAGPYPYPTLEQDFISLDGSNSSRKRGRFPSMEFARGKKTKKSPKRSSTVVPSFLDNDDDDKGLDRSIHALQKRRQRFAGPGGLQDVSKSTHVSSKKNNNNFDKYTGVSVIGNSNSNEPLTEHDFEQMTVKGTCETLEKEYLRLTAPPRAELVRPQHILERHLHNLLQEYYGHDDGDGDGKRKKKKHDYLWFCSQWKAVRQDLTIQRIQNSFAVQVYETHARIALMEGDLNEFNQCQTQLKELYDLLVAEKGTNQERANANEPEFLAYRLLYHVLMTTTTSYQVGTSEITQLLGKIRAKKEQDHGTKEEDQEIVEHALQVRQAVASSDYVKFFRLHQTTPKLGKYLTARMVPTLRLRALRRVVKAYRPSIELEVCWKQWWGFSRDDGKKEGRAWMESCGAKISDDGSLLLTKESDGAIHEPQDTVQNSLI